MKPRLLLLALLLSEIFAVSQTVEKAYPVPEFNNKPAYLNAKTNSLVDLEKSSYNVFSKMTGFGVAGAGFFLEGASSPVKIAKAEELQFIVKVASGDDPTSVLDLVAFTVKKNKRLLLTSEASGWTGSSKSSYKKIPYEVKRIGQDVYLLSVKNLSSGEYFWGSSTFMFAFNVTILN